jgi:hypothetical protein
VRADRASAVVHLVEIDRGRHVGAVSKPRATRIAPQ